MKKRNLGLTAAVGSYLLWGLLPVYWKQLSAVSAYEILSHRIIWSFFFMLMILSFMGRMVSFWEECKRLWADKSRGTLLALASFSYYGKLVYLHLGGDEPPCGGYQCGVLHESPCERSSWCCMFS